MRLNTRFRSHNLVEMYQPSQHMKIGSRLRSVYRRKTLRTLAHLLFARVKDAPPYKRRCRTNICHFFPFLSLGGF